MIKFATTAIGLVAVGPLAFADPGDSEWLGLDSEISGLAAALQPTDNGNGWTALIRTGYTYATDDISTGAAAGAPDISGFSFYDVDLAFWGAVGDFGWRASFDVIDGTTSALQVEDAYATWDCTPDVRTTLGQFKAPVFQTGSIDPENQLFMNRSAIGSAFDDWNQGVMASGAVDLVLWNVWLQNGSNSALEDHRYGFSLHYDLGSGAGSHFGARDKDEGLNATFGFMAMNDDTQTGDTLSYGIEAHGNYNQFGFGAEFFMMDDDADFYSTTSSDYGPLAGIGGMLNFDTGSVNPADLGDDALAHMIYVSYAINSEMEVAFRSEALDNGEDHEVNSVVFNYHKVGNNAKYSVQYTDVDADSPALDGSWASLGLTLGGSR